MKRAWPVVAVVFVLELALAGCGGEEKKPEAPKKKTPDVVLTITGGIAPAAATSRTITIDPEGAITDQLKDVKLQGKVSPEDLKTLQDLIAKVDWAKLPIEFKTADGKLVPDGRAYELLNKSLTPAKIIRSMDGAADENKDFAKLRDTIELVANKIK